MYKKKKGLYMMTAIMLSTVVFLGACSSKTGTTTENSASSSGGKKTELEPYEIVMAYPGSDTRDKQLIQDEMNKITKAKINTTVKLVPIENAAWVQQTNLMLAGNEKLDLLFTNYQLDYNTQVAKGQLLELDSLVEKYGQDIKKTIDPDILKSNKINGKIYGIVSNRDFVADYGIIMRKDIVDKYKIDISKLKSANDLDAVFKTVKQNEPNMTPIVSNRPGESLLFGLSRGTFDPLDNGIGILPGYDNNFKVVNQVETPEYAEQLKLIRQWYQEGYISKDAAVSKDSAVDVIRANKAFAAFGNMKPYYESQQSRVAGTELVAARFTKPMASTTNITVAMFSIPKNATKPERSMMYLNLLYSDKDLVNLIDNGIEGKHYVKKSENTINFSQGLNSTSSGYYNANKSYQFGNQFLSYVWEPDPSDLWSKIDQFNKSAVKSKAYGFTFDASSVKTEIAAVTNVNSQYKMGLETGTLDMKEKLPEYISKLKGAGIDKIIAEKQKQLDEWSKSNKR